MESENISGLTVKSKTLIVIAGATASGKTDLAIQLATKFQTEIISADARQFYRELNIGTAKPNQQQLNLVKHHFINSISIHDEYTVGNFAAEAKRLIEDLFKKYKTVILCGGSGLFIRAIVSGLDEIPPVNEAAKEKVKKIFVEKGIEGMQEKLQQLDIDYYQIVDLNNPYRLTRALEICITSGQPFSAFRKGKKTEHDFNVKYLVLDIDRQNLYNRINYRVDEMMRSGLLQEAKSLYQYRNLNALNTVGYKELFEFFEGSQNIEMAIDKIKQHTRNYAKRQLTWFRKEVDAEWLKAEKIIQMFQL